MPLLRRAKVVIGDLQTEAAAKVVDEITSAGGEAVWLKCDVLNWDDQHALFQLAVRTYGTVDIGACMSTSVRIASEFSRHFGRTRDFSNFAIWIRSPHSCPERRHR